MKKVHFIPGLGADSRSFGFLDLSFCDARFVDWIKPHPNETLPSYAERMFASINDENATIVGMSFGGMLATEIAKKHPNTKVIVIASAKTYLEIPAYLRMWRHFPVYKLHTNKIKNYSAGFVLRILGAKGAEQKKLQQEIMRDHDSAFIRWALNAILNWKNTEVPKNVIHIHGSADKLLPYRYVKADHTINNGEHVMVMDLAEEISVLLKKLLTT
ncbi:MAG: alpha/beta hydrolase [Segetibacter sp.]|nr:alpha/beta hydrolase [Segetibacter sp.]